MEEKTRAEHLAWCKQRAHSELEHWWVQSAVSSICSDLWKHPETEGLTMIAAMLVLTVKDKASAIQFIDWFN